jgi:hypothetical protein
MLFILATEEAAWKPPEPCSADVARDPIEQSARIGQMVAGEAPRAEPLPDKDLLAADWNRRRR